MALQKQDSNEHGQTGEYHKIEAIRDSRKIPEVMVTVHLYFNAQNKVKPLKVTNYVFNNIPVDTGGDEPEILRPYFLDVNEFNVQGENHISLAYEALKQLPEFEGAIDV